MTTRSKTTGIFPALLLVTTFLITPRAEAHAPRAREVSAVIQAINHEQRTLSLETPKGGGPRELVWDKSTKFLRDSKFVPATELKAGTRVTVYYHSPFFGKPFATKIVWITNTSKTKTTTERTKV